MKKVILLTLSFICFVELCFSIPVKEPITAINSGAVFDLTLTLNRSFNSVVIACADTEFIYLDIEDCMKADLSHTNWNEGSLLLRINRNQIQDITPSLPCEVFVDQRYMYKNNSDIGTVWDDEILRVIDLEPSHKQVVIAENRGHDSVGNANVVFAISNLSNTRLKYVDFSTRFYNRVDDLLRNDIGGYTSLKCRMTGFIEPGASQYGIWDGFYNSDVFYCDIPSVTLTYQNGSSVTYNKGSRSILLILKK